MSYTGLMSYRGLQKLTSVGEWMHWSYRFEIGGAVWKVIGGCYEHLRFMFLTRYARQAWIWSVISVKFRFPAVKLQVET